MTKHPMRELADLLESENRIEPLDDGFRIILHNKPFGRLLRREDGWVVTDVPAHKRTTAGSRHAYPSARQAFTTYFGNARTYNPWITELAKQLPAERIMEPTPEPEMDLDAVIARGAAAHDEANRLDGQLRQ